MRILYSMSSMSDAKGGPTAAAYELSKALTQLGHSVVIISHDDGDDKPVIDRGVTHRRFRLTLSSWQFSLNYFFWTVRNIRKFDAVIVNSLFLSHTWFVPRLARIFKVPYSVRPHGSLNVADVSRSRPRLKRIYLRLIDLPTLRRAAFIFCTSTAEAEELGRFDFTNVVVIPLGVHLPEHAQTRDYPSAQILFLGRITAKKGVPILLKSLALLRDGNHDFTAVIAGPADPALQEQSIALSESLGLTNLVAFEGYAGTDRKKALLRSSRVFALPSEDENFGIAPAEALANGVPLVITPGVSHALAVTSHNLGLVADRTPEAFARALVELLDLDETEWVAMSNRAADYARAHYDWSITALGVASRFESATSS